ncbi:MAG: DUF4857 domain-containing protein [Prolixibacteraceae bacterium]|jgi:hypothetical protein|nr:DUF4857 domain-containing protein [Prolixibacteraceae bacterium]
MERTSRYILVLVAMVTSAIVLPQIYWMAFDEPVNVPFVMYSCTDDDFMIQCKSDSGLVRFDTRGNSYTREEYEQKLPLMYTRQLLVACTMPDTIKGVAMDMHELAKTKSMFRYQPEDMNAPQPRLFPLFESESGRASIEMPDDFFRITWRMEFIDASTNKINEGKSRLFSSALYKKGFVFPAKQVAGLPTTRKSCDEGYLVVDSSDQLFHLKMMEGHPYVAKVNLPERLKFRYISCVDLKDKKYYAYLFSEGNEIYILTQDEYELVKLPVEGFDPACCGLRIFGDIFHYHVAVQSEDRITVDVLRYSDYQKVDTYEESWMKRADRPTGKIAAAIFPIQIKMSDRNSKYTNFYIELPDGFLWIIVNLIFVVVHLLLLIRKKVNPFRHISDLGVVTFTGIFGFIAVNFFQNKFFD